MGHVGLKEKTLHLIKRKHRGERRDTGAVKGEAQEPSLERCWGPRTGSLSLHSSLLLIWKAKNYFSQIPLQLGFWMQIRCIKYMLSWDSEKRKRGLLSSDDGSVAALSQGCENITISQQQCWSICHRVCRCWEALVTVQVGTLAPAWSRTESDLRLSSLFSGPMSIILGVFSRNSARKFFSPSNNLILNWLPRVISVPCTELWLIKGMGSRYLSREFSRFNT